MKYFGLIAFLLMISATSYADDFFNPPPLNPELPPWMQNSQDANQPQAQPQQQGQQPQAQPQAQSAQPSPEPAPTVDTGSSGGDDEEGGSPFDFEGGSEGGGGGGRDSGKNNFQVIQQDNGKKGDRDCVGWGSSFVGTTIFTTEQTCQNELDQDVENARDTINNYADSTEKEVLRGVIKGKIPREKSKDFHLEFSSLKDSLILVAKSGCACLE